MENEEDLYNSILLCLEIDHQFFTHFYPEQVEEIERTRVLARRAGRQLGWKVRTIQTSPERRADGKVVVGVVAIESEPEEEQRIRERSDLLIRNMKPPTA